MMLHRRLLFVGLLLALGTAAVKGLEIVAMGDSYAAGVGARGWFGFFLNYEKPFGCFRSPTSYSALFARMVGADTFTGVACGGGSIRDFTRERLVPVFSWVPKFPWQSCDGPSGDTDIFYAPSGWFGCEVYVKPQIEAISPTTDLIILTTGGNDIGSAPVYLNCFTDFSANETECENALDRSRNRIGIYEENLIKLLAVIESKLHKDAKVVLMNYPLFVMDVGYSVGSITPTPDKQARAINEGLNQAMKNAATAGNNSDFVLVYDHTAEDFAGHEVDPRLGPFHLNRQRWILEPLWDRFGVEAFHLNNIGNQQLAHAMVDRQDLFL